MGWKLQPICSIQLSTLDNLVSLFCVHFSNVQNCFIRTQSFEWFMAIIWFYKLVFCVLYFSWVPRISILYHHMYGEKRECILSCCNLVMLDSPRILSLNSIKYQKHYGQRRVNILNVTVVQTGAGTQSTEPTTHASLVFIDERFNDGYKCLQKSVSLTIISLFSCINFHVNDITLKLSPL